ncbi:2326_t:CDS:2 [Racocetra fulgida]|uniref:2326_t:CDS:1 n=1 Tax=Racocetra fulgida TaxID=60492 RepID=A0A9N9C0M0_9GLOM|nr:2326_t:CDS:2 [Racocetra fulgida]
MTQESEDENTELEEVEQFEKNSEINSLVEVDKEAVLELNNLDEDHSDEELTENSLDDNLAITFQTKWKLETFFDQNYLEQPGFVNLLK